MGRAANTEKDSRLDPAGGIAEETRVVLANAIYLRAAWEDEFFDGPTSPQRFLVKGKDAVDVPTMVQTASYGYAKRRDSQPSTSHTWAARCRCSSCCPKPRTGWGELEKELPPELLAKEANNARQEVELHLPKFRIEPPTVPLGEVLQGARHEDGL
jgi:serine protease inhibitor